MDIFRFIPGYQEAIFDTGREPAFLVLLSFVITYLITRGYTRIARRTGWGSASFGGVHTHHMVFGMIIAFTASAMNFAFLPDQGWVLSLFAVAFGCGAALVLDEFALLFHLEDVYWEKEGRKSVDAVVLGAAFGGLFLLRLTPLGIQVGEPEGLLTITVIVNLFFALIAAFKGKLFIAVFGIFVPTLALVGAIRLAEPDSIWSRKLYSRKSKKLAKTKKRYAKYERVWRARKERAWDILGGKVGR